MSITVSEIRPYPADRNVPSPNHGPRTHREIKLIVLHATAGTDAGAEAWLTDPDSEASAHLHFRRNGSVTRLVSDMRRAWHAGASAWPGIADVNSQSLGWEIGNRNDGTEPYTDAQYRAVAAALRHYLPQGLDRNDVVGHHQVAPDRKTDPVGWDWARMWREFNGLPEPEPVDVNDPADPNLDPVELAVLRPEHVQRVRPWHFAAETALPHESAGGWMRRVLEWLVENEQVNRLLRWAFLKVLDRILPEES